MDTSSLKDSPFLSSPFSSPNVSALLKIKIISWSQETGLPVTVRVQVAGRIFHLHKQPLLSKSGYFKRNLNDSNELNLPKTFPGGPETFEMISLFIYGSSTLVDPFNVAALRCAAEFLEMTEDYTSNNLCQRFDIYLNQVVLQSWDDTLIVLQKCQTLLPWAEDLLIVSRCIESLAFMACMEILDPERRRDQPIVTLQGLATQPWSNETIKAILTQDLWIKDLIALPFVFFKRVIGSLRRQGMKEKYVSPIVVYYANKWVVSKKTHQYWEHSDSESKEKVLVLLEGVLDLLPGGEKAGRVIPIGFYFSLLSRSLELGSQKKTLENLKEQIVCVLHLARVEDFLILANEVDSFSCSFELNTIESIFLMYVSSNKEANQTPSPRNSIVAELWDSYLSHIATDPNMNVKRFMDLVEIFPTSTRRSHDHLYKAVNTFLQTHSEMSQEEKGLVCKYLKCQKLSHEVCAEAVQNELMPLRLIVQALFVQQLHTHQTFKDCSDSFRFTHCGEFSGSLSSSICQNSKSLNESPYGDGMSRPLSCMLEQDVSRSEIESTSFRIQSLEQELMTLKKSLKLHNIATKSEPVFKVSEPTLSGNFGRMPSTKRTPLGQVSACIGSVNFASHRKYVSRLLKVLRRITLFGRGKSKRKQSASALW